MIRVYKRKLILTQAQEKRLRSWIGACRVVYNLGLEVRISAWKNKEESVHKYDLMKQVTELRQEVKWIADVPADTLSKVIERLDNSYKRFFKGAGFPKWANKKSYKSITLKQDKRWETIKVIGNKINLPKIKQLKMFNDSPILGDIENATIKIEPTGFFICIQCDNVPAKFESENQTIGLDMGLSHFCVDSNGCFIENPKHFAKYERQLRIENRSLARKKKGSNRWKKQAAKLAILHHKIGNVRKDFLHKESTILAKANCTVFMEDLNIKGMSKNGKLAKHILDAGWGIFRQILSYKTQVVAVNPKHTSQQCNACGHTSKENRNSQSEFKCAVCGHTDNADVNAGKNIKGRGASLDRQREPTGCALVLKSTNNGMSDKQGNNFHFNQ